MNKFMPYLLVTLFAIIVTVRIGYVVSHYYSDSFVAYAEEAETKPKDKTPKTENITDRVKNSDKEKVTTITDKILTREKEKNDKKNLFASKTATKTMINNPEKACITGIMLKDALEKLAYLHKREATIMEQQRLLETSDRRVREQISKLKLIKNEIVESAKLADSTIAKESKRLISIYEKMKPKDAANIFNEMQPSVAAELLRTMKEDQSSQILSKMNPKNAYNVTLSLAGGIKATEKKYDDIRQE